MESSVTHLNEAESASPGISPGVVNDDEVILRELYEPYHICNDTLKLTSVSLTELGETGFSVHRKTHVNLDVIRDAIKMRLSRIRKEAWMSAGVAEILTMDVRKIVDANNDRLLVVIDTATDTNRGHASIYAAQPEKGDAHARKVRTYLMELPSNRKSLEEAYHHA